MRGLPSDRPGWLRFVWVTLETAVVGLGVKIILFQPYWFNDEKYSVAGWVLVLWLGLWLTSLIVGYLPGANRTMRYVSWMTFLILLLIGIATPDL